MNESKLYLFSWVRLAKNVFSGIPENFNNQFMCALKKVENNWVS